MECEVNLINIVKVDLGASGFRLLPRVFTVRGVATVLFRLSQVGGHRIGSWLGLVLKQLNHVVTGADLAWQARVGPGMSLYHPTGVVIGPDVKIGCDFEVQGNVTLGAARQRGMDAKGRIDSPRIGNGVRIGAGAVVVGPIEIGDDVVVGANAFVGKSARAGAILVGVAASELSRLENADLDD